MSRIIKAYTKCAIGDFTQLNCATYAAFVDGVDGISVTCTQHGWDTHLCVKTIPTAPYSVTINLSYFGNWLSYQHLGMVLRDSATGKYETFVGWTDSGTSTNPHMHYVYENFNNSYATRALQTDLGWGDFVPWMRITDDSTYRKYWLSRDGVNWTLLVSQSRTSYMTPNQIGFEFMGYSQDFRFMVNSFKVDTSG
jgi:hypothetical protein